MNSTDKMTLLCLVLIFTLTLQLPTAGQTNYEIMVDQPQLNLDYNSTKTLRVNVTLNNSPVNNTYFRIEGLIYDIGEAQQDLNNGTYVITFSANATQDVAPGNYNVKLVGTHQGNEFSTDLVIVITSTDATPPVLHLISPDLNQISNLTVFVLKLNLSDETAWLDLNITVAGESIVYFKRVVTQFNDSVIFYNTTFLYYETIIDLTQISGASSEGFSIIARDTSFNEQSISTVLEGDYTKPQLKWIGHGDQVEIHSRFLELTWEVSDASAIRRQSLYLEDRLFLQGQLAPDTRTVNFTMPINPDKSGIYSVRLEVEDIAGNVNQLGLTVIFNLPQPSEQGVIQKLFNPSSSSSSDNSLLYGILGALVVLVGGVVFIIKRSSKEDEPKREGKRDVTKIVQSYPLEEIRRDFNGLEPELPARILKLLEDWHEQSSNSSGTSLQNELEFLRSNLEFELNELELTSSQQQFISKVKIWLDNITQKLR